jgi:LmbE family N-acetylglucosaminyl deacetylase
VIEAAVPARALAVFAHPDDPEVGCGGTLARWTAGGSEVHLVIANRGDKGSLDPSVRPDALAADRAEEVARAAAVLGLASVEHWGYPDGEIDNDATLRARIVEAVRRHRPTALVAPDPSAVFFGDGYINHRDHRQLGWAVLDSVVPAGNPLYVPDAGPAHQIELLLLSGTLEANAWVDVGDVLDVKVAAVACHESRLGSDPSLIAAILEERAREEGARAGVTCAEGFRRLRFTGSG